MRRTSSGAIRSIGVLILALAAALAAWRFLGGAPVNVVILQKQGMAEIAHGLKDKGVIYSPRLFRLLAELVQYDRHIRPGMYHLRLHMGSGAALWKLTHSQPDLIKIVIPEGFSARQIAERLEANGVTDAATFMDYVSANHLEGYLFPATYSLMPNSSAEAVAHEMHQEFKRNIEPEFAKFPPTKLSEGQVITLASIVQREATLPQERPMIAAVYLNRLTRRKPLEADPTVQYALGAWKKGLTLQDLKIDSPYNTYVHFGLPPSPICSPGVESVRAVLDPSKTDALYFVADNTGGHAFSATYEEHLKAKYKAKRERRLKNGT